MDFLSFRLNSEFVNKYRNIPETNIFGFSGLGLISFYRTYSRKKADGSQETWADVCERVINGMYSIQKDHVKKHNIEWDESKAHHSAEEAFDRLFTLKWSPSGRGLWMLGTEFVHKRKISESLLNCAFITTDDIAVKGGEIFYWFMESLMLGIGVGSDMRGREKIIVGAPKPNDRKIFTIPDTREGWAESVKELINSYLYSGRYIDFDYSLIRPKGEPIRGFGGVSSGPEPLRKLHEQIRDVLDKNVHRPITTRTLADIFNLIGTCVVSGNVRRSAEILFSDTNDSTFRNLKNYDIFPEREEIGWASNNSIMTELGTDYDEFVTTILKNGEPGFAWMENVRQYGRMGEEKPDNAIGFNPCGEIALANKEMCNLVEIHIGRNENLYDYLRTLKFAYLYGKTVTLTYEWIHDAESRLIMTTNRRVGLSNTGTAQFIAQYGLHELKEWFSKGYEFVKHYDLRYSNWLKVPQSIRLTTSKPSGTVSLLSGSTPGVHYPHSKYYIRRIRLQAESPLVRILGEAGIYIEPDLYSVDTVIVEFPVYAGPGIRSVKDINIWEQLAIAAFVQRYWSDNSVSVTVSIDPSNITRNELVNALNVYQYQLKSVSILPIPEDGAYKQMPYETITQEAYEEKVSKIDFSKLNNLSIAMNGQDKLTELYCNNDACLIDHGSLHRLEQESPRVSIAEAVKMV